MALTRRAFLVRVLGAAAAVPVIARLGLPAVEAAEFDWQPTFKALHEQAWRHLKFFTNAHDWPMATPFDHSVVYDGSLIGHTVNRKGEPVTLTHQPSIMLAGIWPYTNTQVAMAAMADQVATRGLDTFGALKTTLAGVDYAANIGSLRMVVRYSVRLDCQVCVFDLLGGASLAARQRLAS